jgi:hypothetical protein
MMVLPVADAAEGQEATLARRVDRITRQIGRLERDLGISLETVALFIQFRLMVTRSLPERERRFSITRPV